jgi:NAD(P)H dehydrogenase (quinone)
MLEYLGLEVLDPFVAYAAPRVDAAAREVYLRDWETRVVEAVGDRAWQARLAAVETRAEQNRTVPDGQAWAARR